MGKRRVPVGKIRRCNTCRVSKIFFREANGHYHCETCGCMLVETAVTTSALHKALVRLKQ